MAIRHWPFAPTDFARSRLVLSSGRGQRRRTLAFWLALSATVAGIAVAGVAWNRHQEPAAQAVVESKDVAPLRLALEQSALQLRMAEARSHELEHQIDALNKKLRESQEELTFFRKTRDARR